MVVRERSGNVMPLETLLWATPPGFSELVLSTLREAGFEVTVYFDVPRLAMPSEVAVVLAPTLSRTYPKAWDRLGRLLQEASQAGVLVDLRSGTSHWAQTSA